MIWDYKGLIHYIIEIPKMGGVSNRKARRLLDRWLILLQTGLPIETMVKRVSVHNRYRVANLCLNIRAKGWQDERDLLNSIINTIRESVKYKKEENSDFNDFVKMVQSHPTLRNIKIGKLINDKRYRHLLPKFIDHVNVCVKMLKSTRVFLCNHSLVAKSVFDEDSPIEDRWD